MTSSASLLERELLGSSRDIIDAHSNIPLTKSLQQNTYRTSYGISNPLPYPCTTISSTYLGYGTCSTENFETKRNLSDVNKFFN